MSGSNSSVPGSAPAPEPLSFSVHSLPDPRLATQQRQGRWKMLLVLAMCAAPVVASYFTFHVIKPRGSAYGELIEPTVELPDDLPLRDLAGQAVAPAQLRGRWQLAVVQPAECPVACERQLFVQRQLREMLGKERDRFDKLWLIPTEAGAPASLRPDLAAAVGQRGVEVRVLQVPRERLEAWLKPAAGKQLSDHFYVIDTQGRWMLREPSEEEPAKVKRMLADLNKLLKAQGQPLLGGTAR